MFTELMLLQWCNFTLSQSLTVTSYYCRVHLEDARTLWVREVKYCWFVKVAATLEIHTRSPLADLVCIRIIIGYVLFFTLLYFPNCWTALLRWGHGNSETLSTQSRKRLVMVWYAGASAGASWCYFCVNLLSLFCCRKTFLAFHALGPYLHFTTLCPFKKKKKKKKGIWKQASFTHKAKIGLCPKCVRVCMYWYVCRSV